MTDRTKPWKTVLISVLVFLFSLTQTAFTTENFNGDLTQTKSLHVFLGGGFAILGGGLAEWIIWMANPLYFTSMFLFLYKKKSAVKLSLAALLLALSFSMWSEILASESGYEAEIVSKNAGYWLWIISLSIVALSTRVYFKTSQSTLVSENK